MEKSIKNKENQTHLAIFCQPYLNLILEGKKTIESRFSKFKIAPYNKVKVGDKVIMKESGGFVLGEFTVEEVRYYDEMNINKNTTEEVKSFSKEICSDVDLNFWQSKCQAKYVSLIKISNVIKYKKPRPCHEKKTKDMRGWIVLKK
ncbi:MAG TPA: ASCH domain-containing protein [Rickettsiales bacterium]|nr:ASCH domain-containing protein [Rickettsiales bacterium]